ncbi:MAG TPA: phosphate ABC transporter substrate-binding/OmpA family protein [Acidobacteriota bacterium]|nr:phosphate ABC transporter substrate-binding/OmpA family protein [Acidobacteriota bacterium]
MNGDQKPQAKLTALGVLFTLVLILGLIGLGIYLVMGRKGGLLTTEKKVEQPQGSQAEAPDLSNVTTVKEYKYVPAEKLPGVKGVSNYEWDNAQKIVKFSYNVWIGWLPIIAANHGTKPNKDSIFYKKYGFQVELVLIDDPITARDAYAAGKLHSLWGTVDMMTLFAPELMKDSRTAPRVVQQIDWSNGGDGIVVRDTIKSVSDLRGKTIVCAQNSPSEYFVTELLLSAGLRTGDVKMKYTTTAFEAAAAFVADKKIDAVVSWSPDIYNISDKVPKTRLLSTTKEASKIIADVYAFRADFYRDHPDIVKGFVACVFDGMDYAKQNQAQVAQWVADAYGMKPEDINAMLADAHSTNFAENVQFFLNSSNPTNFERTWKNANIVYRELGRIDAPVAFDQVMDFSIISDLDKAGTFKNQKDESVAAFVPQSYEKVSAEAPILTQTIRINFYPNSANLDEPARDDYGNVMKGQLYDPNVDATVERVARLAGQFANAVIIIEGHTDSSMKGRVPEEAVKRLSMERADAVKQQLIKKFKFDPNKFVVQGRGWDKPADPANPLNQALNRRVEISVVPPEQNN